MSRSSADAGPARDDVAPPGDDALSAAAGVIDRLARADDLGAATDADVQAIVSAAVRLYAKACLRAGAEIPPVDSGVATTEAVVLACALARAHSLTPFDLALWFSHTAPEGTRDV